MIVTNMHNCSNCKTNFRAWKPTTLFLNEEKTVSIRVCGDRCLDSYLVHHDKPVEISKGREV